MKTKVIVLWVICIVLLVGIAPTRIAMDRAATPDYEEVQVTVVSSKQHRLLIRKQAQNGFL